MVQDRMFAFRVTFEHGGRTCEQVVAAPDLVGAAVEVRDRLPEAQRILEIRSVAEVLAEGTAPPPPPALRAAPAAVREAPCNAPPAPTPPPLARRTGGTRESQLLSVLTEVGGPVHLDVVAEALGVNRAYADNIALRALRSGAVQRVGTGTGLIELAPEGTIGQPVIRRRIGRGGQPTHLEQVLELVRSRSEPVHIGELVRIFGLSRTHVDNVVADGCRYGLLQRLDDRSGRVTLAGSQGDVTP